MGPTAGPVPRSGRVSSGADRVPSVGASPRGSRAHPPALAPPLQLRWGSAIAGVGVVAASLTSAGFFAVSTTLKHRSAAHLPDWGELRVTQLPRLVRETLTHPLWLTGILTDVGGLAFQVYALHVGALSVVQPLLVSGLLFSLALSHVTSGSRLTRSEAMLGVLLTGSLVAFLVVSGATSAAARHGVTQVPDRGPAWSAATLAVVLAAGSVFLARSVPRGRAAALIGAAVGICYASTAALIKSATDIATNGVLPLLTSWQLYTLVAVGAAGLLLNQIAFQAGPLSTSLPVIATVDPLLSVAVGVWIYDERLNHSAPAAVGDVVSLLLLSAATVALSRRQAIAEEHH